jgi:sterol desaturase/sphingolipid hydroxylase (fatty acid hydroxylase superfamily)
MSLHNITLSLGFFVLAFIFASLIEYWLHRLMHYSPKIGKRHRDHHRRNEGQGVIWEFKDYVQGGIIFMCMMFFISWPLGISWFLGSIVYAAFSAYSHQLQHDNPTKCFWMKMPVHYVHHKYNQWHHNFGLAVDWWDHIFGTYQSIEWLTEEELNQPPRGYLEMRWW